MHTELLTAVVGALDKSGIPHMIAGSFASTFHSDPRMTRDIDLVIEPQSQEALRAFAAELDTSRYYIGDYQTAFADRQMFNIIDTQTGWKADLMMRRDRPFSIREFARRQAVQLSGVDTFVASVEDTILAKLDWSRDSESTRQFEDVIAMLRARRNTMDLEYLAAGAQELGVSAALDAAVVEADR